MKFNPVFASVLILTISVWQSAAQNKAITFEDLSGTIHSNVTVIRTDKEGVLLRYGEGTRYGRVQFTNMSEQVQLLCGFDAKKPAQQHTVPVSETQSAAKTNKARKLTEREAIEEKWKNYINSQPLLKQRAAELTTLKAELAKVKANYNYLRELDEQKEKAKGNVRHWRDVPPAVQQAEKLASDLDKKVSAAQALVTIERIKWEKAMGTR